MAELSNIKLLSQARACKDALKLIIHTAFHENKPADRVISAFFRENHKYGSRDRQLISESIFSVFRWWGGLRKILKPETLAVIEGEFSEADSQKYMIPDIEASRLLLAANLIENSSNLPDACSILARETGIHTHKFTDHSFASKKLNEKLSSIIQEFNPSTDPVTLIDMMPSWLISHLMPGAEPEKLANFFQRRPPMWLRSQTDNTEMLIKKLLTFGFSAKAHPLMHKALCVENARINLYTLDEFRQGLFEIQDLASQVIGSVCSPLPSERWWDACAGAGGKTLQLADAMQRKGTVVATDIREYKLEDLRKRARRAGFPNIVCQEWNGKALRKKKQENFDGVLVDAPCSCSGTWRRNPDARWTMKEKDLAEMSELQFHILQNASSGVKPGGVLVYATCSLFIEENSKIVEKFLAEHQDFSLEKFTNPINGTECAGTIQVYPWDGNCDSMFAARMRRKAQAS